MAHRGSFCQEDQISILRFCVSDVGSLLYLARRNLLTKTRGIENPNSMIKFFVSLLYQQTALSPSLILTPEYFWERDADLKGDYYGNYEGSETSFLR